MKCVCIDHQAWPSHMDHLRHLFCLLFRLSSRCLVFFFHILYSWKSRAPEGTAIAVYILSLNESNSPFRLEHAWATGSVIGSRYSYGFLRYSCAWMCGLVSAQTTLVEHVGARPILSHWFGSHQTTLDYSGAPKGSLFLCSTGDALHLHQSRPRSPTDWCGQAS